MTCYPDKSLTVSAGWLIDGTGSPLARDIQLDISDGRIVSISDRDDGQVKCRETMDLSHCTIIPGLIDCHVHLSMSGNEDRSFRDSQLNNSYDDIRRVIAGHLMEHYGYGVVALRDGGDHKRHALRYRDEYLMKGREGVVIKAAGRAWHAQGRYGSLIGRSPLYGLDLAQSISLIKDIPDHIKIINSGLNSLSEFGKETPAQFDPGQLGRAVKEGKKLGLKTMVHANGQQAVKIAIDAGCHSIEHGFFMGDENLGVMAEKGCIWVPTAITMEAYSLIFRPGTPEYDIAKRNLDSQLKQISMAIQYGVNIAVGTDSGSPGVHHGKAVHEEIRLFMSAGYTIEGAVRCASFEGAKLLGLEETAGLLTPGMPAVFIAVRGGPESLPDSLGNIEAVFSQHRAG